MRKRRGLAIVNMLLFVIMFTILAGVLLSLVSSQTRVMETYIRRVKALYAVEAGTVAAIDALRRGVAVPNPVAVEWTFDTASGNPSGVRMVSVSNQPNAGILGTQRVNATLDYSAAW